MHRLIHLIGFVVIALIFKEPLIFIALMTMDIADLIKELKKNE